IEVHAADHRVRAIVAAREADEIAQVEDRHCGLYVPNFGRLAVGHATTSIPMCDVRSIDGMDGWMDGWMRIGARTTGRVREGRGKEKGKSGDSFFFFTFLVRFTSLSIITRPGIRLP